MIPPICQHEANVKYGFLHIIDVGHSFVDLMPYQAGSSAQRIRIGLTGLALAFLIVLLGSIVIRSTHDEAANAAAATTNAPSEPLAELGVAPGSAEATNNTSNSQ